MCLFSGTKKATTSGAGLVKSSSSTGSTKVSLDEKMAKAQRLKEQQEAERKKKLEEKQAREAQKREAIAQRKREMDAKKASKLATTKPKATGTSDKPEGASKPKMTAPVSRVRSGSTKTATSIPKAPAITREVKKPTATSTRVVATKTAARAPIRSAITKAPVAKTNATSKASPKSVSSPSKTITTRPTSTRPTASAGASTRTTTNRTATTAKTKVATKTSLKKSSSAKAADVKVTRIKPPTKTTKENAGKQDKKLDQVKEDESCVNNQAPSGVDNEVVTSVVPNSTEIEIDIGESVVASGESSVPDPLSNSETTFTPDTANRVSQIIANQTNLSQDLRSRLPNAIETAESEEPQHSDEVPASSEAPEGTCL